MGLRQSPRVTLAAVGMNIAVNWALDGHGILLRAEWDVARYLRSGRLVEVLEEYAAPPNGIYVVFPQRKHMPLRVRLWIDFLKHNYSQPGFWTAA